MERQIDVSIIIRRGLIEGAYVKRGEKGPPIMVEVYDYDNMKDASAEDYHDFCEAVKRICEKHEQVY